MKVVVVGAGVIGCAVAHELASRGAAVTLVDMRQPGAGATQASAGILAPYIEGHAPDLLRLGVASLSLYDGFVRRVEEEAGRRIEYRRRGTLEVALTDAQAHRLRTNAERYAACGVAHHWLDRDAALGVEPSIAPAAVAALLAPSHGYIGATGLTAALVAAAGRKGVTLLRDSSVLRVDAAGASLRLTTPSATLTADAVVLAAGSWSGQIAIERAQSSAVRPIKGQIVELTCSTPPASRVLWGADCYLVPWTDGTVLVGATVEDVGFDEHATAAGVGNLLRAACALLPCGRDARFTGARVGLRPCTRDELPVIGRSARLPGVIYATGHHRNGVLLAPFTARAVADLVLDGLEAPELAATRPSRFGL